MTISFLIGEHKMDGRLEEIRQNRVEEVRCGGGVVCGAEDSGGRGTMEEEEPTICLSLFCFCFAFVLLLFYICYVVVCSLF